MQTTTAPELATLVTPTGTIYGTIELPSGPGAWPVVLLIAGSGPTDRDGNTPALPGKNNSLLLVAQGLAQHGIASLRYDKRGIAASAAAMVSESALRFDMYADDAASWARQLRADKRFSSIIIAGHSEGSLLGMIAAQRAPVQGFVSLSGAGRPAGTIIREQLAKQLPPDMLLEVDRVLATLLGGNTTDQFPAALASLFRPSVQPYLISWFRYDPAAEVARLSAPVLIAQGSTDIQVPLDDARLLAAAKPEGRLLLVEGMNHVMKMVASREVPDQLKSYSDPALPVSSRLMDALVAFVKSAPTP